MNIMLSLCAICAAMTVMLLLTKFLSKKRKWILIGMELIATFLLFFDRLAYIYAGNTSYIGYTMVRVSNFMVFFLTSGIVLCFNFYLIDLLTVEGKLNNTPLRLTVTSFISLIGMLLTIISAFTGLYYYFDAQNLYHRGPGFLICYIVPVLCPIIQFTAIFKYRKCFSKFIFTAVCLYIFMPVTMGILQIFTYGISIVNMTMVLVSVFLYFFTYLDVNAAVEKAHKIEIQSLKEKQKNIRHFFEDASAAFAYLIETQNGSQKGYCEKNAKTAKILAQKALKSEEECNKIYYAAYLCDAGADSLSLIKEYPYLSETALYVGQNYNKKIPEYSRLITVAKDYNRMVNNPQIPKFFIRDTFIRESGRKYDPLYAKLAVLLLDEGTLSGAFEEAVKKMDLELFCKEYRQNVTTGIEITQNITTIAFDCVPLDSYNPDKDFSAPSIILFDSYDKQVQKTQETIDANKYIEYGEVWFDAHINSVGARNMEVRNIIQNEEKSSGYSITACRFEDHLLIKMNGEQKSFEVIVALPSPSKSAYIGITGENVHISNIRLELSEKKVFEDYIPRIAEKVSYIDRIQSDVPNLQITKPMADFRDGIQIKDKMQLFFHAQSLPDANLVWHCPYIILYYSEDKKIHGTNYREYAMIKFDGEDNGSNIFAENSFLMKKTENFKSWEEWENQNKIGYECKIEFSKTGNEITLITQNKGIYIQNTTKIKDGPKEVYAALSGDQVALTDIRIR